MVYKHVPERKEAPKKKGQAEDTFKVPVQIGNRTQMQKREQNHYLE